MGPGAEAAEKYRHDERTACKPELDGLGDAGDGNGNTAQNHTEGNTEEYGQQIGLVQSRSLIAHKRSNGFNSGFVTYNLQVISHLDPEVRCRYQFHSASHNSGHCH